MSDDADVPAPPSIDDWLGAAGFIDAELDRIGMQLSVLRISREEVGRRLDLALTRQELNRPDAPVPAVAEAPRGGSA